MKEHLPEILGLVVLIIEFVLGKTKLVKANSTVELVLNSALKILLFFAGKEEEQKKLP